jgi:hypothetical protein
MRLVPSTKVAISLLTLAACAVWLGVGPASAETTHKPRCVGYDNLTEVTHTTVATVPQPSPGVGLLGTVHDDLSDASGKPVATSDGSYVVYANPDGSMSELIIFTDTTPAGTATGGATVSFIAVFTHQVISVPIVGKSGLLRGMVGTHDFQLVGSPTPTGATYQTKISLCAKQV